MVMLVGNENCTYLYVDNGESRGGGANGGERNTADSWEYTTQINTENGTLYYGSWNIDENT